MQDMRFFQHFLQYSFPHHPLGNDAIWTHEVPCLSYNYEFLMHSILGLAASELIASDASLAEAAMAHRLKSIQAIKRKLAASDQGITYAEGNALIATCFALTFQSVILEDGSKCFSQDTPCFGSIGDRSQLGKTLFYSFPGH